MHNALRNLGIDGWLIVFFVLQALLAALGFSVWALIAYHPFDDTLARLIAGTVSSFALAILLGPLWLPLALTGWAATWFLARGAGLPMPALAAMADAAAGLGAALTVAGAALGGCATEGIARNLVAPLLCITPVAGAICGFLVYRQRWPIPQRVVVAPCFLRIHPSKYLHLEPCKACAPRRISRWRK